MRKFNLKEGMIAHFKNNELGVFVGDTFIGFFGGVDLSMLDDNLNSPNDDGLSIQGIYQVTSKRLNAGFEFWFGKQKRILEECRAVWLREKKIPLPKDEYTIDELKKIIEENE